VIYVYLFEDNFDANFVFFFIEWREKSEEKRKEYNLNMREKVVQKLSQNNCSNIISLNKIQQIQFKTKSLKWGLKLHN